jgi:pimeloyl-ACP methyl ester carboxylesterase
MDFEPKHLVILVHGISTRALWMSEVKPALEAAGFEVAQTSFGPFSVLKFLSPSKRFREFAIERVVTDVRLAREAYLHEYGYEPSRMSVIAHSFGTWVISEIFSRYQDFKWNRVVFCGSVIREDFPLQDVTKQFGRPLLNEIGTKDWYPAIAESLGWGYGSVGSTGFNRPPVETRWHEGYKHSDFLTAKFCKEFWVPFLNGEKPAPAGRASHMPMWVRIVTAVPLRWVLVSLCVLSAALALGLLLRAIVGQLPPQGQASLRARREVRIKPLASIRSMHVIPPDLLRYDLIRSNEEGRFVTGTLMSPFVQPPFYLPIPNLSGKWTFSNGDKISIKKSFGGYISESDGDILASGGHEGSNVRYLGCYYDVKEDGPSAIIWSLKKEAEGCLTLGRMERSR